MSKKFRPYLFVLAAVLQILQFFTFADAQDVVARINVDEKLAAITVDGSFTRPERSNKNNLSLLRDHAGTIGLAERFGFVELLGGDGKPVNFRKLIAGEYLADTAIASWKYAAKLAPTLRPSSYAHISWLGPDRGILMTSDVLPQMGGTGTVSGRVTVTLPAGWEIFTSERRLADGSYEVADLDKGVLVIYRTGQARVTNAGGVRMAVFDTWLFSDAEASAMAAEIAKGYADLFGDAPQDAVVTIMRFPGEMRTGAWEADTRGSSVSILSSDMPFKAQSLQRLHEQLRHEIFHLWLPNGVNLSGNYDWFYEGFALYQSLKSGVASNRLRFEDYLAALSQALVIDNIQVERISLIDASKQRWSGSGTRIYARGMLTAFLCDIAMLKRSKGKASVSDLLRDIYGKFHASKRQDGNDAILALMRERRELTPIVDAMITGSGKVAAREELLAAGIEMTGENALASLKIVQKPNGRQKDLLDKLGYNNWRKLAEDSK